MGAGSTSGGGTVVRGPWPALGSGGGERPPGAPRRHESATRGLRLTRRGVVVLWLLVAALALGSLVAATTLLAPTAVADTPREEVGGDGSAIGGEGGRVGAVVDDGVVVVVHPGDTLWAIAREHSPERDPRDVVAEIVERNALPSPLAVEGDVLVVPVG